jgi:glycosyltransferase involved in cell wall biosynthesis
VTRDSMSSSTTSPIRDFVREQSPCPTEPSERAFEVPSISIIIPVLNGERFLERTLNSVLNQHYPRVEIIVMDGGSTDSTVDILRRYNDRISHWETGSDNGQADALNKGLSHASSDLIGWQNADDIYLPGAFAEVARLATLHPDADFFSGNVNVIDEHEEVRWRSKFIRPTRHRLLYEGFIASSQGVFWRRKVHDRVGAFLPHLHYAMDYDFWLRCLDGGIVAFTDQVLGCFRMYPGTKTWEHGERGTAEINDIRRLAGVNPSGARFHLIRMGYRIHRLLTVVSRRGIGALR